MALVPRSHNYIFFRVQIFKTSIPFFLSFQYTTKIHTQRRFLRSYNVVLTLWTKPLKQSCVGTWED